MSSLVPKQPPPKLDHRAHPLRLSLEMGQIATMLVTIVALARSGLSLVSGRRACDGGGAVCRSPWATSVSISPREPGGRGARAPAILRRGQGADRRHCQPWRASLCGRQGHQRPGRESHRISLGSSTAQGLWRARSRPWRVFTGLQYSRRDHRRVGLDRARAALRSRASECTSCLSQHTSRANSRFSIGT